MKNEYNFKQVFEHPVVLYRMGKLVLPFGISLARVVLMFTIFIIMIMFRNTINMIIPHNAQLIVFTAVPYLLSTLLLKFRKDGKKIHHFLYDFFQYLFTVYIPKRKYCNDQEVLYTNQKITFEPIYMKKGANEDEVKNANEADIQQPTINRKRRHLGVLPDNAGSDTAIR